MKKVIQAIVHVDKLVELTLALSNLQIVCKRNNAINLQKNF